MKNRITMAGHIDPCWLFVYRGDENQLRRLLPTPLNLVTKGGFGFVNVVVCELSKMRPAFVPFEAGLSYWHIAYRIYAEAHGQQGLYFLRSDADSKLIVATGNLLTDFKFHSARVTVNERRLSVQAVGGDIEAHVSHSEQKQLTMGSPFGDLPEAKEFLKYKPAALTTTDGRVSVLRITRDEAAWRSRLVEVTDAHFEYLESMNLQFELCYEVEPIDYVWNRAVVLS